MLFRSPDYRLWRLTYLGDSTHAPVLSRVGAETGVEISILQGVISRIKNTPYGQLVIGLRADEDTAIRVLKQLSAEDVRVDVITQQHLQQEAA